MAAGLAPPKSAEEVDRGLDAGAGGVACRPCRGKGTLGVHEGVGAPGMSRTLNGQQALKRSRPLDSG